MINKTYVINLSRQPKRKAKIISEFEKLGNHFFNYSFFEAIDGKDGNLLEKYNIKTPTWHNYHTGKMMTNGEIGCAMSHYLIWLDIVTTAEKDPATQNDFTALILEDDIHFQENFIDDFNKAMSEIIFHYELLYVGRQPCGLEQEYMVTEHIRTVKYSYGAHAYILKYQGANKLVSCNYLDNIVPTDDFLAIMYGSTNRPHADYYKEYSKLVCYAVHPNLVAINNPADSDTYNSEACVKINNYIFVDNNENKEFVIFCDHSKFINDAFTRFSDYCNIYGLPIIFENIETLRNILSSWTDDKSNKTLIMFIQYPNVIVLASPIDIINKFKTMTANNHNKIVAENNHTHHTKNSPHDYYSFIGWGDIIKNHINGQKLSEDAIIVDGTNVMYQHLNVLDDSTIKINFRKSNVSNVISDTTPCFFVANNNIPLMNTIENYTGNNWNEYYSKCDNYEKFIHRPTCIPNIYVLIHLKNDIEYLKVLHSISYPKDKLYINIATLNSQLMDLIPISFYENSEIMHKQEFKKFLETDCHYFLYMEENYYLTGDGDDLSVLVNHDKNIIAPLLKNINDIQTNFWGAVTPGGYYSRSFDYIDIANNVKKGIWNVPYVRGVYLIKRHIIDKHLEGLTNNTKKNDYDMFLCEFFRKNFIFMYVTNIKNFGYIKG